MIEAECRTCGAVGTQATHVDTVHAGSRKLSDVPITGYTANVVSMLKLDLESRPLLHPGRGRARGRGGGHRRRRQGADLSRRRPYRPDALCSRVSHAVIGVQSKLGSFLGQTGQGALRPGHVRSEGLELDRRRRGPRPPEARHGGARCDAGRSPDDPAVGCGRPVSGPTTLLAIVGSRGGPGRLEVDDGGAFR